MIECCSGKLKKILQKERGTEIYVLVVVFSSTLFLAVCMIHGLSVAEVEQAKADVAAKVRDERSVAAEAKAAAERAKAESAAQVKAEKEAAKDVAALAKARDCASAGPPPCSPP